MASEREQAERREAERRRRLHALVREPQPLVGRGALALRAQHGLLRLGGLLLLVATPLASFSDGKAPLGTVLGRLGLLALALAAGVKALRMLKSSGGVGLPVAVGGRRVVGTRLLRTRIALTLALGVGLPMVAALTLTALVDAGWMIVTLALAFGVGGYAADASAARRRPTERPDAWPEVGIALTRLCMRADMPVPPVVIENEPLATAWTAGGRVHLTVALLESLGSGELEAVLAHELAHLAHNDAAVMDIATSPSRLLLSGVAACRDPGLVLPEPTLRERLGMRFWAIVYVPPALLLAWASRLMYLGLSRARELTADAAAATLTGRPSALASALMKLDERRSHVPLRDLRLLAAREGLCVLEIDASRFGRLLHTHPPIEERIERLRAMEERLQSR